MIAAIAIELTRPVIHDDETAWVANAYYGELLISGDVSNPDWRLLPAQDSPIAGKLAFALALRAIGRPVGSVEPLAEWYARYARLPGAWGTGAAYDRRREIAIRADSNGSIGPNQIQACRRVALVAGMLAALAVGSIGLAIRGPATGAIAGLAFALHPVTVPAASLAMFDTMAVLWSIVAVRLMIGVVRPSGARRLPLMAGLGLSVALAIGTKMNALIVVTLVIGMIAFSLLRSILGKDQSSWLTAPALVGALVIAITTFVVTDPAFYPNLGSGLANLFRLPAETTRVQAGFLPDFLESPTDRARVVGRMLVGFDLGLLPIAMLGAAMTIVAIRRRSLAIVPAWFWWALVLVTAWIPFAWPRYVLPLVPCTCLIAADALVSGVARVRRALSGPKSSQVLGGSATMSDHS